MIQTSSALNTHAIDFSFYLAPHYLDVCDYIEKKYNECYNAQISCDYQHLLVVTNGQGEPVAAVGYRTPDTALFLEQFTRCRINRVGELLKGYTVNQRHG